MIEIKVHTIVRNTEKKNKKRKLKIKILSVCDSCA